MEEFNDTEGLSQVGDSHCSQVAGTGFGTSPRVFLCISLTLWLGECTLCLSRPGRQLLWTAWPCIMNWTWSLSGRYADPCAFGSVLYCLPTSWSRSQSLLCAQTAIFPAAPSTRHLPSNSSSPLFSIILVPITFFFLSKCRTVIRPMLEMTLPEFRILYLLCTSCWCFGSQV